MARGDVVYSKRLNRDNSGADCPLLPKSGTIAHCELLIKAKNEWSQVAMQP